MKRCATGRFSRLLFTCSQIPTRIDFRGGTHYALKQRSLDRLRSSFSVADKQGLQHPPYLVRRLVQGFALVTSKLLWDIRYRGKENIPRKDAFAYIVASNHQAYFDPAWISAPIPQKLSFMAWGGVFEWKFVGPMIRFLGAFPVDLGGAKALGSIKNSLRVLKNGAVLVIFPEGERAFGDGDLQEFKEGVAIISIRAQVPILPVTIKGGNKVWAQGQKGPHFFTPVEITYHPLIHPPEANGDSCDNLTAQLREVIGSGL
jgi:1-acyl-sn-glycerol-3-phosphate acyltransferase